MLNLGFFELTLFGIIALIVLGPDKLPVAARTVGRWYGMIRRASTRLQSEISNELQLLETQEQLKNELAKIRESEAQMQAQMTQLQQSLERTQQQTQLAKRHTLDAWQTMPKSDTETQTDNDGDDEIIAHAKALQAMDDIPDNTQSSAMIPSKQFDTMPLVNRWFLLGDYDRRRRLPPPPWLPNYIADPLLYQVNTP